MYFSLIKDPEQVEEVNNFHLCSSLLYHLVLLQNSKYLQLEALLCLNMATTNDISLKVVLAL
jgi:hypothetical protein